MNNCPVIIEFKDGSRIESHTETQIQDSAQASAFESEAPQTYVVFSDDRRVALPSDQVVLFDDAKTSKAARIGLGGMSFEGMDGDQLVFWRVQDIWPEEVLSPQRELRVLLEAGMISNVQVNGQKVWPAKQATGQPTRQKADC